VTPASTADSGEESAGERWDSDTSRPDPVLLSQLAGRIPAPRISTLHPTDGFDGEGTAAPMGSA
jgi:hypothetical protein